MAGMMEHGEAEDGSYMEDPFLASLFDALIGTDGTSLEAAPDAPTGGQQAPAADLHRLPRASSAAGCTSASAIEVDDDADEPETPGMAGSMAATPPPQHAVGVPLPAGQFYIGPQSPSEVAQAVLSTTSLGDAAICGLAPLLQRRQPVPGPALASSAGPRPLLAALPSQPTTRLALPQPPQPSRPSQSPQAPLPLQPPQPLQLAQPPQPGSMAAATPPQQHAVGVPLPAGHFYTGPQSPSTVAQAPPSTSAPGDAAICGLAPTLQLCQPVPCAALASSAALPAPLASLSSQPTTQPGLPQPPPPSSPLQPPQPLQPVQPPQLPQPAPPQLPQPPQPPPQPSQLPQPPQVPPPLRPDQVAALLSFTLAATQPSRLDVTRLKRGGNYACLSQDQAWALFPEHMSNPDVQSLESNSRGSTAMVTMLCERPAGGEMVAGSGPSAESSGDGGLKNGGGAQPQPQPQPQPEPRSFDARLMRNGISALDSGSKPWTLWISTPALQELGVANLVRPQLQALYAGPRCIQVALADPPPRRSGPGPSASAAQAPPAVPCGLPTALANPFQRRSEPGAASAQSASAANAPVVTRSGGMGSSALDKPGGPPASGRAPAADGAAASGAQMEPAAAVGAAPTVRQAAAPTAAATASAPVAAAAAAPMGHVEAPPAAAVAETSAAAGSAVAGSPAAAGSGAGAGTAPSSRSGAEARPTLAPGPSQALIDVFLAAQRLRSLPPGTWVALLSASDVSTGTMKLDRSSVPASGGGLVSILHGPGPFPMALSMSLEGGQQGGGGSVGGSGGPDGGGSAGGSGGPDGGGSGGAATSWEASLADSGGGRFLLSGLGPLLTHCGAAAGDLLHLLPTPSPTALTARLQRASPAPAPSASAGAGGAGALQPQPPLAPAVAAALLSLVMRSRLAQAQTAANGGSGVGAPASAAALAAGSGAGAPAKSRNAAPDPCGQDLRVTPNRHRYRLTGALVQAALKDSGISCSMSTVTLQLQLAGSGSDEIRGPFELAVHRTTITRPQGDVIYQYALLGLKASLRSLGWLSDGNLRLDVLGPDGRLGGVFTPDYPGAIGPAATRNPLESVNPKRGPMRPSSAEPESEPAAASRPKRARKLSRVLQEAKETLKALKQLSSDSDLDSSDSDLDLDLDSDGDDAEEGEPAGDRSDPDVQIDAGEEAEADSSELSDADQAAPRAPPPPARSAGRAGAAQSVAAGGSALARPRPAALAPCPSGSVRASPEALEPGDGDMDEDMAVLLDSIEGLVQEHAESWAGRWPLPRRSTCGPRELAPEVLRLPATSLSAAHLQGCPLSPAAAAPPPALQPGELRLCGLTFHPELAPGVRSAMEAWEAGLAEQLAAEGLAEQIAAEGLGGGALRARLSDSALQVRVLDATAITAASVSSALVAGNVFQLLGLEREPTQTLPGLAPQLGSGSLAPGPDEGRGGAGLFAAAALRKGAVLGVMGGYVMPRAAARRLAGVGFRHISDEAKVELAGRSGAGGSVWVRFAWQLLESALRFAMPGSPDGWELSMLGYGSLAALINDPRREPRGWVEGNDVGDEGGAAARAANCAVVPVSVRGLTLPVVVALRDIQPGEQLLRDYGAEWWRGHAQAWYCAERFRMRPAVVLQPRASLQRLSNRVSEITPAITASVSVLLHTTSSPPILDLSPAAQGQDRAGAQAGDARVVGAMGCAGLEDGCGSGCERAHGRGHVGREVPLLVEGATGTGVAAGSEGGQRNVLTALGKRPASRSASPQPWRL